MRRVYIAEHPIDAHFVKDFLASAGIESVVRGEHIFALRGVVPMTNDTLPSVWLVDEEDYPRAELLVKKLQARARLRSVERPEPRADAAEEGDALASDDPGQERQGG